MDQHAFKSIHSDWGKYHETKIDESAWKIISCEKIPA